MKIKFCVFLILIFSSLYSQSISGIVVDENNEPLLGATVYIDGSSYGTTTNFDGKFRISIPSKTSSSLVVSFVGYDKMYINNLSFENPYRIILKENIEGLKEIVVSNNRFSRKQMLAVFRYNFLGNSKAGKKCTIENEDEIYFKYDNDRFVLLAYADKPLIVNNPYLGYKIHYDLVTFDAKFRMLSINTDNIYSSLYAGLSRYEETDNSEKIIRNREKTYKGSILELFRCIALNEWSKENYLLYRGRFQDSADNNFKIKDTLGIKQVFVTKQERGIHAKDFVAEFSLLYDRKEQSKIIFHTNNFYIDNFGIYSNYEDIYLSGALSEKKLGDSLPSNYGID